MESPLHTQNEIEDDWNEMKSNNGDAANSRCSASAGSDLSLYAEMEDLAKRFEERAKALEATLEDESDGSDQTRYRWKIKAGMFRSVGMEIKQRLRSWQIYHNDG